MKKLCILGSTGSIGENTLDIVRQHPDLYRIVSLSAHTQIDKLAKQVLEFLPQLVVVANQALAQKISSLIDLNQTRVLWGEAGLLEAVLHPDVDTVMAAIVGAAGLLPTLESARSGKRVLLANKEALVMSGQLMMNAAKQHGAILLPIDSEHNAIFQCLSRSTETHSDSGAGVEELILTASGGPFLHVSVAELAQVTPDQACAHPNWVMGRKISVDSATMMNKGLELIEAMWLFNMPPEKIQVLIHPQSVIHSMVRYIDGSVLAQLGQPDMRTPIAYGLAWPNRTSSGVAPLHLEELSQLTFLKPDIKRFPALRLARDAAIARGTAPTILNAANEIAVASFLDNQIPFTWIDQVVEATLERLASVSADSIEIILMADQEARDLAKKEIERILRK
jgi:1-deoxy-D-xylulose-5-phosphate reductoisomerase